MENRFTNQTAIITGAGQGIGFEIARQIAIQGGNVLLNDIDAVLAERAAKVISAMGGKCHAMPGDASDIGFIQQMVDEAVRKFGFVTIAIANAGITSYGDFLNYKPEALESVIGLNIFGSFFLAQKAALQMQKQGSGGSILFMSSVTGHQSHEKLVPYGVTKAAVEMLARGLVIELAPLNISVNAVAPGATATERTLEDKDYEKTWSRITPMGRPARVEDVANAVLFLVSPESRHITGQTIVVDGGWTATSPSPY
ncbi:MAG TPA: SDR family oxidoreductase [Mucilaginibacter sp.]|jgi:3-oxoacyl-[acyl-carrier protein] reductase|nr:SDR family oxidoreductase [Mucilaginibacter sp.]